MLTLFNTDNLHNVYYSFIFVCKLIYLLIKITQSMSKNCLKCKDFEACETRLHFLDADNVCQHFVFRGSGVLFCTVIYVDTFKG